MHWIDWVIVVVPVLFILGVAVHVRKYVRGVADFLVAGRYVIAVGDMQSALSIVVFVAICERDYQCGIAMGFRNKLIIPLSIFMSLTGYCLYRFRQTKCMSLGQFLEIRYSRSFRIVAASVRGFADMVVNSIGPAVAARFFTLSVFRIG